MTHPPRVDIQLYVDGMLEATASTRLWSHVERCASCSQDLGQILSLAREIEDLPELSLPAGFATHVAQRSAISAPGRRWLHRAIAAAILTSLSLALTALLVFLNRAASVKARPLPLEVWLGSPFHFQGEVLLELSGLAFFGCLLIAWLTPARNGASLQYVERGSAPDHLS